jgi:hypothetical protein
MTESPWKPGGEETRPKRTPALAAMLLIRVVGVAGFVGLLATAQYARGVQTECRIAALLWFAIFGVAYVVFSQKTPNGGRRGR